jgi:NAD(P)-dependent dehydrogenase (short-subunit alcohol dehydrogenase family)
MTVTLINGADKGLGYETARRLIERGHTVYIGARSIERERRPRPDSAPGSCISTSPTTRQWRPPCV